MSTLGTRFREVGGDYDITVKATNTSTGSTIHTFNGFGVHKTYRGIFDSVSSRGRNGRYPVRSCTHDVHDMSNVLPMPSSYNTTAAFVSTMVSPLPCPLPISGTGMDLVCPLVPSSIWSDLSLEAFNYFSEVFPEELSLGEFIQGIVQLKQLLPEVQESISKTVSGGYLNKQFGWDNLLRDLDILSSMFSRISERIEYLQRTHGIPTRLGFHRRNIWVPSTLNVPILDPDGGYVAASEAVRHTLTDVEVSYRATAWIHNSLPYVDGVMGWIRGFSSALGLDNPVKTFWNLLPFSFVVDWFTGVDAHLDRLLRARPAVGWAVNDVSASVTSSYKVTVAYVSGIGGPQQWVSDRGTYHRKIYQRVVGLPIGMDSLIPSSLTPEQLVLLTALVHQQR
jgi:hypothetical protein